MKCGDQNHTAERDAYVLDVMTKIIEVSHKVTCALFIVVHLILLYDFVGVFELNDRIFKSVKILEEMVSVEFVLFTVFTLARGACVHFWVFNQMKLRHVAASDCSFSELTF